jgi:hypothetical protein
VDTMRMRDEKSRNAYKRYWRNMRNVERHTDAAEQELSKAVRSLNRAWDAKQEMAR